MAGQIPSHLSAPLAPAAPLAAALLLPPKEPGVIAQATVLLEAEAGHCPAWTV